MKTYSIPQTSPMVLDDINLMQTDVISTHKEYSKPGTQLAPPKV